MEHKWIGYLTQAERLVPIDQLMFDDNYQRGAVERHVSNITKGFDFRLFDRVRVSQRGEKTFAVVDGRQRVTALRELGYQGSVPCTVTEYADAKEEAVDGFLTINEGRHPVNASERFRSSLFGGRAREVDIVRIVEEVGVPLVYKGEDSRTYGLRCFGALVMAYDKDGPDILREAVRLLVTTTPGQQEALGSVPLRAMVWAVGEIKKDPRLSLNRLEQKLRELGWLGWFRETARVRQETLAPTHTAHCQALRLIYNKDLKSRSTDLRWEVSID